LYVRGSNTQADAESAHLASLLAAAALHLKVHSVAKLPGKVE
jgi:hypothetical protein